MGHCIPWILLLTYTCYLGLGVGAILWTWYGFSLRRDYDIPDANYDQLNVKQENILNFLFVVVSCGTSVVVAALITLVGICSRSIFNTTLAIHGSLSLGILHMAMIVLFLLQWRTPGSPVAYPWSAEINGGFLGLCALQIILGIIHLKRQKKTWITLNFKELFSLNSCFFIARTVLTGYLIDAFVSSMLWSFRRILDCHQCPPWSFYFSAVSIATCIVVNSQCLLSVYFGSLHRAFAILNSFVLTVVCGCMSVVNSPYYISRIYNERVYIEKMFTFSLVLTIVQLVHLILLVVKPNGTLLELMRKNLESLRLSVNGEALTQLLQSSRSDGLNTKKKIDSSLISLIVSFVSLILIGTAHWWYPIWPKVILVSLCVALLSRSLSAVLYEFITHKEFSTTFQVLLVSMIEFIPVLVGAIGVFAVDDVVPIIGAIILLGFYVIQFWQQRVFILGIFKGIKIKINEENLREESETLTDSPVTAEELT